MPFIKGKKLVKERPKESKNKAKNEQEFENGKDGLNSIDLPQFID
tara:strand:- start:1340 stop:1474 length:135 start_codon:yes stop_codon:yes gene_type:complete